MEGGLTRIKALSWIHNGDNNQLLPIARLQGPPTPGIVIGFTNKVHVSRTIAGGGVDRLITENIFEVLVESDPSHNAEIGLLCRCPIRGTVIPVEYTERGPGLINTAQELPPGDAPGVAFLIQHPPGQNLAIIRNILSGIISKLWVVLRGDFVKDWQERAIDAEFVRAELPTGDRPRPPDDQFGSQGGLFESWFQIQPPQG